MYKIERVKGELKQWTWNEDAKVLRHYDRSRNTSLGIIQLVSIVDANGQEVYEQPWWLESRGEVDIVVDQQQRFLLVEAERHSVIEPELYRGAWRNEPPAPFAYPSGVTEPELPRGFAGTLVQEAEEETRYRVDFVAHIGHANANTSFLGTSPFVVVCKATPDAAERPAEATEPIRRVVALEPHDIARLKTYCNFTKGALWDFCRWASREQADPWWREVAEKIVAGWSA